MRNKWIKSVVVSCSRKWKKHHSTIQVYVVNLRSWFSLRFIRLFLTLSWRWRLLVYESQQEECYVVWAPVACVWGNSWPVTTLHQTFSELKVDASFQLHCRTNTDAVKLHASSEPTSVSVLWTGVQTHVTCQVWVKWVESRWKGRRLTDSLPVSAPLPQCLSHRPALGTLKAGCWSVRSVRRACHWYLCRCSPLLREDGVNKKKEKKKSTAAKLHKWNKMLLSPTIAPIKHNNKTIKLQPVLHPSIRGIGNEVSTRWQCWSKQNL